MDKKSVYKCVVIDDEPIAIKVIKEHLEKLSQMECIGSYTKPLEAINTLNNQKVDLLFLDINMPGISGVELLKSLTNPPRVIFTTAYRNFAVDAFELDAMDYLVKPISFDRFLKAVNKFLTLVKEPESVKDKKEKRKDFIILKSDKKNYKIRFDDILYIESLDNYIKVHTTDLSIVCYDRLSAMENLLPEQFLRIHRSYIVNSNKIEVFSSSHVQLDGKSFSMGRNYKDDVIKKLNS